MINLPGEAVAILVFCPVQAPLSPASGSAEWPKQMTAVNWRYAFRSHCSCIGLAAGLRRRIAHASCKSGNSS